MKKPRILIFPAGTEIGLTIRDSLRHMTEVEIWGGTSADDHSRFAFKNLIPELPYVADRDFIDMVAHLCELLDIDYIYPAHDDVIYQLAKHRDRIPAEVIAPDFSTVEVCRYKSKTYRTFPEISPRMYAPDEMPSKYPVFVKPDNGQGSNGCHLVHNAEQWSIYNRQPGNITLEYLPGREYTVDCFSDRHGQLRFCQGRSRNRIKNGIAVRTERYIDRRFEKIALNISARLPMRGQWFFQVKESAAGQLTLLEIAPRPAGSSILWTAHGVWLPQLTVLDRMGKDIEIKFDECRVEMDRALGYRFYYYKDR